MIVFTLPWIGSSFPFTAAVFEVWKNKTACSVALAQEIATESAGDGSRTVVYGFSAGVGPALFASLQPGEGPIRGCVTEDSPSPVMGVVLGDGPYFLHDEGFDESFEADPEGMQGTCRVATMPSRSGSTFRRKM